jgi:hypothetical protein
MQHRHDSSHRACRNQQTAQKPNTPLNERNHSDIPRPSEASKVPRIHYLFFAIRDGKRIIGNSSGKTTLWLFMLLAVMLHCEATGYRCNAPKENRPNTSLCGNYRGRPSTNRALQPLRFSVPSPP